MCRLFIPASSELVSVVTADEPQWYWWECAECVRRLTLSGALVFIEPGKITQVVAAAFLALAWLSIYAALQPFEDDETDMMATVAQHIVFLGLFVGLLIKVEVLGGGSSTLLSGALIFMNMIPPMLFVFLFVKKM